MSKLDTIIKSIDVYDDTSIDDDEATKAKRQIKDLMIELIGKSNTMKPVPSKWEKGVKIGITMLDRYDGHPQYIPTRIKDKNN